VIAETRAAGDWQGIVGIPTSRDTEDRARRLGIPLADLQQRPAVDLTIDGADEVDDQLDLIKGLGGALLREKIVASVSARLMIIVDQSKRVARLGTRVSLPVEVDPFAAAALSGFFRAQGAEPALRRAADGRPFVTDGGHHVVDLHFARGIDAAEALDVRLRSRPGVLETGLFLGMADTVFVAGSDGIHEIRRSVATVG
jgi:ribose 5-phosphate isomerase A